MIVQTQMEKNAAENIRYAMKLLHLSLADLGEAANVNPKTIHAFINGRNSPRFGFVVELAAAIGSNAVEIAKAPAEFRRVAEKKLRKLAIAG